MGETPEKIGPYRVLTRLGAGGMAETFVAEKHGPGGYVQRVCVKRIRQGLDADPDYVRQFLAEARIAATLRHTNVAQVVDFGQDGPDYWLALELIEGMDLRALLGKCGGRLSPDLVAHLGVELASALDVAHRAGGAAPGAGGIVHRDVSPSNVLLSLEGEVKLTDFGIARRLDEPKHTRTGIVRGKVPYMAPEYAESGHFDHRSDLFALGVLLYETLSGQRPHDAPAEYETLRRATAGDHPALATLCPEAPAELCEVIERLLAPDPAQRTEGAAALLDALTPLRGSDSRRELARLVHEHHDGKTPDATVTTTEALPEAPPTVPLVAAARRAQPRTGRPIAVAVVGLPLLLAGAVWLLGHDIRPTARRTPAADPSSEGSATAATGIAPAPATTPINGGEPARDSAAASAANPGQLTVIVLPFGKAAVDGDSPRETPLKLELAPGEHLIRATGRGQQFERTVLIEPGQSKRVVFQ